MKIAVLGSGSSGNSIFLQSGSTRILVDAGFSGRDIERRLALLEVEASSIEAIVVTHEHSDHTRGVGIFARRFDTPVYITLATERACSGLFKASEERIYYEPGVDFRIGPFRVEPFLTVHDAIDPVAVTVVDEETGTRVGVATDLGRPTTQVRYALRDLHFLVLEANHDEGLLMDSSYPWSVKERIASSHGHLSNDAAAELARDLFHSDLAGVILAHLSKESNRPDLAKEVVGAALRKAGYRGLLEVAASDRPTELIDIPALRARTGPAQLSLI